MSFSLKPWKWRVKVEEKDAEDDAESIERHGRISIRGRVGIRLKRRRSRRARQQEPNPGIPEATPSLSEQVLSSPFIESARNPSVETARNPKLLSLTGRFMRG